jgi:cytochrome c5
MRSTGFLLLAGAGFFYLASCTYEKKELPEPVVNCDTAMVTYSGTISPMIQTYCSYNTACHANNGGAPPINTHADLKARVDNGQIQHRVFTLKDMPPSYSDKGPVPACDLAKLKAWIDKGAQNN